MDSTEWIALSIVALAVVIYISGFFIKKKRKSSSCCKQGCPVEDKKQSSQIYFKQVLSGRIKSEG